MIKVTYAYNLIQQIHFQFYLSIHIRHGHIKQVCILYILCFHNASLHYNRVVVSSIIILFDNFETKGSIWKVTGNDLLMPVDRMSRTLVYIDRAEFVYIWFTVTIYYFQQFIPTKTRKSTRVFNKCFWFVNRWCVLYYKTYRENNSIKLHNLDVMRWRRRWTKKNECTKIQNVYYIFDIIGVDFKYTRPSS